MMIALCITGIVLFIVSGFEVYLLIELWSWQDKYKVLREEYQHLFNRNVDLTETLQAKSVANAQAINAGESEKKRRVAAEGDVEIAKEAAVVLQAKIVDLEAQLAAKPAKSVVPARNMREYEERKRKQREKGE